MKVLITGSAGFIGQHLVKRLSAMYAPHAHPLELDIKFLDDRYVDIRDEKATRRAREMLSHVEDGIDACVHLAAIAAPRQAQADPKLAWETNVLGTYNVLTLCRELDIRKFVFMSSAHVYGISPKYMPSDEWHPLSLLDTYTSTKIAGEKLCELFHSNYGLSATCLRLFNAYGPGQSKDYFIGAKIEQAKAGGPVTLMNGEVTKDWVWVEDVVDAIVRSLRTDYVGPINVGTGSSTSLGQIAAQISESFGVALVPDSAVDKGADHMLCDNARAKDVLHWEPKVVFADGLKRLIEFEKTQSSRSIQSR